MGAPFQRGAAGIVPGVCLLRETMTCARTGPWGPFLLMSLVLACAGAPRRAEGVPSRVVVLAASEVTRPSPRGFLGPVRGEEQPRDVVARAGAEALRARGYEVVWVETEVGPTPSVPRASALARQHGAQATVVLVLLRLDGVSLQPTGQTEVELELRMVGPTGHVWASDDVPDTRTRPLPRARADWRAHVRQAVIQAVRTLP